MVRFNRHIMATHNKITQEEIEALRSRKYTAKEFSQQFNRNESSVRQWASELKVKFKKPEVKRKYFLNETVFDQWNEEMSYWLGFIYADGCVHRITEKNSAVISISLQKRDEKILQNFKKFIETDIPIFYYKVKQYDCCRVTISSKKLHEALCSLGAMPNKTKRLKFPENIPDQYLNHFIRGYFDGDGHIRILKNKSCANENLMIQITGQVDFLESIKNIYNLKFDNLFGYIYKPKIGNFGQLRISGIKSSLPFMNWLYQNSNDSIRLERKYQVYEKFSRENDHKLLEKRVRYKINKGVFGKAKFKWEDIQTIRKRYVNGEKRASMAREYNVDYTTIDAIVKNKIWKQELADFYTVNNL